MLTAALWVILLAGLAFYAWALLGNSRRIPLVAAVGIVLTLVLMPYLVPTGVNMSLWTNAIVATSVVVGILRSRAWEKEQRRKRDEQRR